MCVGPFRPQGAQAATPPPRPATPPPIPQQIVSGQGGAQNRALRSLGTQGQGANRTFLGG